MDDKKSKSSKTMKIAIVLFAIGFIALSFQIFMRLVYITEQYMARWQMWVWFIVAIVFLVPAFTLFYLSNKYKEAERIAYFEEYFEKEEQKLSEN